MQQIVSNPTHITPLDESMIPIFDPMAADSQNVNDWVRKIDVQSVVTRNSFKISHESFTRQCAKMLRFIIKWLVKMA